MTYVRAAAVAGTFYPDNEVTLKRMVRDFLDHSTSSGQPPKAIIAPHAGYIYSGPIAASAYHLLESCRDQIKRVVLLGPSHRVALIGLAASSAESFSTPLGNVQLDQTLINQLSQLPQVKVMDEAHMMEHSLEVHLPFYNRSWMTFCWCPWLWVMHHPLRCVRYWKKLDWMNKH